MKNYAKLIKLTLLVVSSTLMFSCSDDDSPQQNNSITDIASENPNFSILMYSWDLSVIPGIHSQKTEAAL